MQPVLDDARDDADGWTHAARERASWEWTSFRSLPSSICTEEVVAACSDIDPVGCSSIAALLADDTDAVDTLAVAMTCFFRFFRFTLWYIHSTQPRLEKVDFCE